MRKSLYCVFDRKADAYMEPFNSANDALALRAFAAAVSDKGHAFYLHAEDFTLWRIGEFDHETGTVAGTIPEQIESAFQVKRRIETREREMAALGRDLAEQTEAFENRRQETNPPGIVHQDEEVLDFNKALDDLQETN